MVVCILPGELPPAITTTSKGSDGIECAFFFDSGFILGPLEGFPVKFKVSSVDLKKAISGHGKNQNIKLEIKISNSFLLTSHDLQCKDSKVFANSVDICNRSCMLTVSLSVGELVQHEFTRS